MCRGQVKLWIQDTWPGNFFCLPGNAGATNLFDGEPDHLVPSSSAFIVDSDLFLMAGRMIGHCFLNGGPALTGLSPAIVHVLCGGTPETALIKIDDCPDLDLREKITLVCILQTGSSNFFFKVDSSLLGLSVFVFCLKAWREFWTLSRGEGEPWHLVSCMGPSIDDPKQPKMALWEASASCSIWIYLFFNCSTFISLVNHY